MAADGFSDEWALAGTLLPGEDEPRSAAITGGLGRTWRERAKSLTFYVGLYTDDDTPRPPFWLGVDLGGSAGVGAARFVTSTRPVTGATLTRRPPEPHPGLLRPVRTVGLRARVDDEHQVFEPAL